MKGFELVFEAGFLTTHISLLEKRFCLSYARDFSCVEYFLDSIETSEQISENLILSWDTRSKGIYVSKFYPKLCLETASKYLSAACFYLIVFHAVHEFHLKDECTVWLETDTDVFQNFYSKLKEFEFRVSSARVGNRVCLKGIFHDLPIHTRPIERVENIFSDLK